MRPFLTISNSRPFSPPLPFLLPEYPRLRCSICIYHQSIVIVNYNYYKRLHEIINSDKISEKKRTDVKPTAVCVALVAIRQRQVVGKFLTPLLIHRNVTLT